MEKKKGEKSINFTLVLYGRENEGIRKLLYKIKIDNKQQQFYSNAGKSMSLKIKLEIKRVQHWG